MLASSPSLSLSLWLSPYFLKPLLGQKQEHGDTQGQHPALGLEELTLGLGARGTCRSATAGRPNPAWTPQPGADTFGPKGLRSLGFRSATGTPPAPGHSQGSAAAASLSPPRRLEKWRPLSRVTGDLPGRGLQGLQRSHTTDPGDPGISVSWGTGGGWTMLFMGPR